MTKMTDITTINKYYNKIRMVERKENYSMTYLITLQLVSRTGLSPKL